MENIAKITKELKSLLTEDRRSMFMLFVILFDSYNVIFSSSSLITFEIFVLPSLLIILSHYSLSLFSTDPFKQPAIWKKNDTNTGGWYAYFLQNQVKILYADIIFLKIILQIINLCKDYIIIYIAFFFLAVSYK